MKIQILFFTFVRFATMGGAKFRVFCGEIGFLRGLANSKNGGVILLRGQFFPEKGMKVKEIGPIRDPTPDPKMFFSPT